MLRVFTFPSSIPYSGLTVADKNPVREEDCVRVWLDLVDQAIYGLNRDGTCSFVNTACVRLLGYESKEDLVGKNMHDLIHHTKPDGAPCLKSECRMCHAVEDGEPVRVSEQLLWRADGTSFFAECASSAIKRSGEVTGAVVTIKDITDRKVIEDHLEVAKRVFETSVEGVTITDANSRILYVNPAFTKITGYTEDEAVGKKPNILRSDRHGRSFYEKMWNTLKTEGKWCGEIWNRRKNGEAYPEWLSITAIKDRQGKVTRYVGVFHDLSDVKLKDETIEIQANYDALTGLPNRTLYIDRLEQALVHARRGGNEPAALVMNIDRFRNINDGFGYTVGDRLLQMAGDRLRLFTRREETVARLGGDRFAFILESATRGGGVLKPVHRIMRALADPFTINGHDIYVTASVGVAQFPGDGKDAETLVRNAEVAMYKAKEQGRNTYCLYTPMMNTRAFERLELESALRKALEREELIIYYQPKLNIKTGVVVGAEALLRWAWPEKGLVSPADFIPVAEETGLIIPIGEWTLKKVCERVKVWSEREGLDLPVAVNLSARQFEDRNLVGLIQKALSDSGADPELLEVEITESTVMENVEDAVSIMREIRSIGVKLAMDDFGTGYSSLSYLKRFPINSLKIDRSFVRDITTNPDDAAISILIIAIARNLGLKVIAEGVETEDHLRFLREHNCDEMQGYLFSPPVPEKEFIKIVKENVEAAGKTDPGKKMKTV